MRYAALLLILPLLAACGNPNHLRYQPQPQPRHVDLFADYQDLQNAIGVVVDTSGERLEDVFITRPDGAVVRPLNIVYPPFGQTASVGPGIGVGAGPVGVGVGASFPVGPERALGMTSATFAKDTIGPPPWTLTIKVHGADPATLRLGGPPTAK